MLDIVRLKAYNSITKVEGNEIKSQQIGVKNV